MAAPQRGGSADRPCIAGQDEPSEGPAEIPDPAGIPDGGTRQETSVARSIRAQNLVSGRTPAEIAAIIRDQCGPEFGTTSIRAYRLAFGVALADVVAQVRARYAAEGRPLPRFSETLLSAYESAQKRPGPEYMHYLCAVYQADPQDFGYQGPCFCGHKHSSHDADQHPDQHPDVGSMAPRGATARRLSALRPVPDPRDGIGAAVRSLPPGAAAAGGDALAAPAPSSLASRTAPRTASITLMAPVALMPALWGAAPDTDGDADDDVLRRALLRLIADTGADSATAIDGPFFGAVARIRRRMDDALLGASVSATMLDQWEDSADGYGRQYRSVAPLRLLCDVLLELGDVRRMCEGRQPLEFAERLCRLAAKLAALAGMTMINIGDQRLARSFFRTARMAADETGDRHLRGWVTVRESMVPLYYADPGEAALLARAGGDLAGKHSCVASVMAPVMEARALARLASAGCGSVREALRQAKGALDRAHLALGGLTGELRSDTAFGYTERQILFHQGDALITLGDYKSADEVFELSLQMYSPGEILDRSLIMLGQARCRLEAEEPEEALRLSRDTVLALPPQHRSGLVVRTARSLGESVAAEHGDLPAIREYREALLTG
jgi:tetratricopeptide (TPR) repeat protein